MATVPKFDIKPPHSSNKFRVSVGIDFGTDGVALAYAFKESNQVFLHTKWSSTKYSAKFKTKTIILLDENYDAIGFGKEAKHMYMVLEKMKDKWLLFERFKMALYSNDISIGNNDTLKATNGKQVKASVVFIAAFKYLQKEARNYLMTNKLTRASCKDWKDSDIQWIITVPAIWNDEAKYKMREWAIEAGLVDKDIDGQCKIVYEPDCASLAIQQYIHHNKAQINNFTDDPIDDDDAEGYSSYRLEKGDKYILVDAGGGTVDIACHEILGENGEFGVKEVLAPSGGPWGSCYIDDKFVDLLKEIFSNEWIEEFKETAPELYIGLIDNFQRAKAMFYTRSEDKEYNVEIPYDFIVFIENKLEENDQERDIDEFVTKAEVFGQSNLVSLPEDYLAIKTKAWMILFDYVIDPITNHIEGLLQEPKMMRNCTSLCLVGGLSSSPYFQARMRQRFGQKSKYKLSLIIPKRPILSVVEGAAYYGITDNYIKTGGQPMVEDDTSYNMQENKEMETPEEDMDDIVDVDVMEELEERLKEGMEKWILAYYQFMELKHELSDHDVNDGIITCNGPDDEKSNGDNTGGLNANKAANKSNSTNNKCNNRRQEKRKNDKNEDDEDEEQKGDGHHNRNHNVFQPQCNHLNECGQCSSILATKLKQIETIREINHNLQQQQKYHSSFMQTMDEMLKNGPSGDKSRYKSKKKKRSKAKKNASNGAASYEPINSFRAKGNIKIKRKLTTIDMRKNCRENITDFHDYLDKTVAINYNNHQFIDINGDQKDDHVATIKLDLHEKVSGNPFYCNIERENDEDKNEIYKFKIAQIFTPSFDSHHPLPTSPRDKFQINHQMDQIRDYLKSPTNIEQMLKRSKWNKIQVFGKKQNTQRMALYITPHDLNQKIKDYLLHYQVTMIPIVMFGDNKNWIEYIVVIDSYSFGSIGVSLMYDKRGQLNIANLQLDWTAIRKQHEIAMPMHMKQCKCFDGTNPLIDHIHVGNPDDVENKIKSYQTRYDMVSEVLCKVKEHAYQYIDNLHSRERIYSDSSSPSAVHGDIVADINMNRYNKIKQNVANQF